MAVFTIELRKILDRGIDVGLNDYPIFDESYRPKLNQSITEHFAYREIGFETVDMFVNRFRQRMNLLMPVYNKLFVSTLMEFDPLTTTRIVTDSEGKGTESGTANTSNTSNAETATNSDSKSRSVASDYPQTMLAQGGDYATSASDSVSESGVSSTATDTGVQESVQAGERDSTSHTTMEGYTRTPSELVLLYRETLINVDAMLIADLEPLFMQLWNNSDEYGTYPTHFYGSFFGGMF